MTKTLKLLLPLLLFALSACSQTEAYFRNLGNDWMDPWYFNAGVGPGARASFRCSKWIDLSAGWIPVSFRAGMLGRETGLYTEERIDACMVPVPGLDYAFTRRWRIAGSLNRSMGPGSLEKKRSVFGDRHRRDWAIRTELFLGAGMDVGIDFKQLAEAFLFGLWDFCEDDRLVVKDGRVVLRYEISESSRVVLMKKMLELRKNPARAREKLKNVEVQVKKIMLVPAARPVSLKKSVSVLLERFLYEEALIVILFREGLLPQDIQDPALRVTLLYDMGFKSREIFKMLGV